MFPAGYFSLKNVNLITMPFHEKYSLIDRIPDSTFNDELVIKGSEHGKNKIL